jgi:hypothetical protein
MSEGGGGGGIAESKPKSKITLFIIGHGADIPDNKIASDPSVRILSQAGKFGCWGFFNNISLVQIKWRINHYRVFNLQNSENTYKTLEWIKDYFKPESDRQIGKTWKERKLTDEDNDQLLKGNKTINYRQFKQTEKKRESNEDWQIYTPIMDHMYDFNDKRQSGQGIFIVDIINKPESCKLKVDDDLLRNIGRIKIKDEFNWNMSLEEFFKENSIFDKEREREMSETIYNKIGLESLWAYVIYLNRPDLRERLIKFLGQPIFDKILSIIHEKYVDLEYKDEVLQSKLIKFLKDQGFDIINIIDKSCRTYGSIMSKDQFAEINANEDKASESIDKTQGGKKQTRKRRKKKQRKFKTKSQRKSKTTL